MFCSGATVCSWDNSTRGLDASTALDYAKSLRLLTDIMGQTTFVSLYQAGEGIFDQFDKVLVLNEGHVAYFGPAKEARQYMIGLGYRDLPRQTTADYLSGCTDVNERRFADGRDETNVPATPEEMGKAYRESEICARMNREREEYKQLMAEDATVREDFKQAVLEQKHKGVSKKSPYTVSFFQQIFIIFKRQVSYIFVHKKKSKVANCRHPASSQVPRPLWYLRKQHWYFSLYPVLTNFNLIPWIDRLRHFYCKHRQS